MKTLTFREEQFVKMFDSGMSDDAIATQENVSVGTVRCYRHAINKKLGLAPKKGNAQAMPYAKQKKYDELVRARIAAKVAGDMPRYEKICRELEGMFS